VSNLVSKGRAVSVPVGDVQHAGTVKRGGGPSCPLLGDELAVVDPTELPVHDPVVACVVCHRLRATTVPTGRISMAYRRCVQIGSLGLRRVLRMAEPRHLRLSPGPTTDRRSQDHQASWRPPSDDGDPGTASSVSTRNVNVWSSTRRSPSAPTHGSGRGRVGEELRRPIGGIRTTGCAQVQAQSFRRGVTRTTTRR
jgi:hypothetical protein